MKRLGVLAITCVLLASCATPMVWYKEGELASDLRRDSYECERDARMSGYFGGGIVGALEIVEFQSRCMMAHGYYRVPADSGLGPKEVR